MKHAYSVAEAARLLGLTVEVTRQRIERAFGAPRDVLSVRDLTVLQREHRDASALFESGIRLEETDADEAIDAYSEAVAADPRHADAHVNVGRLLHQAGRLREAEAHYVAAIVARPQDAIATFNLAVVLEDLGRLDDAITRYRETLELDPTVLDAYFNLARLYEKKGEKLAAFRHLKDYRRLAGDLTHQ